MGRYIKLGGKITNATDSLKLNRTKVYISNVVNYRPPANRRPTEEEIERYLPYLESHIEIIDPKILIPGTGSTSVEDSIVMTKHAVQHNVKAVLLLPPFYYKNVTDEGVINYYRKIIEDVGANNFFYILYVRQDLLIIYKWVNHIVLFLMNLHVKIKFK